jgi:hypothetical protein
MIEILALRSENDRVGLSMAESGYVDQESSLGHESSQVLDCLVLAFFGYRAISY